MCKAFDGYLQIDAKYISVKGHKNKMAFIWAIDYNSHDVLWYELVSSETYAAYLHIFAKLKAAGYRPRAVICDELPQIWKSAMQIFPGVNVQLCTVHLKRNIRKALSMKNPDDVTFFQDIKYLFASKNLKYFAATTRDLLRKHFNSRKYVAILRDLMNKESLYTTYLKNSSCPSTTNLIECYNKHLNKRLRKIDGFGSSQSALMWLNAYVYYKRTSKLTSCKGKFKYLNGKIPLSLTAREDRDRIFLLKNVN